MADRFDTIPQSHVDILESKCFAHVATIRPDGRISNHPVSILWDGEHVRFSTTKARRKYRNLLADDRITLSIPDPTNIWRYLEIRGRAVVKDDRDRTDINAVARKYMGQDVYPFDGPEDERVTVTVHVEQVSAAAVHATHHDGKPPEDWTR
jgi:hypothetical protein